MFNGWDSYRRTGQALAGKSSVRTKQVRQGQGPCLPLTPPARSFELSGGFTSNVSFCYLAQELLPPDGGEGEAPEEEERGAGGDRQAPGGESPKTPGGKPQSRECRGLPLLGTAGMGS